MGASYKIDTKIFLATYLYGAAPWCLDESTRTVVKKKKMRFVSALLKFDIIKLSETIQHLNNVKQLINYPISFTSFLCAPDVIWACFLILQYKIKPWVYFSFLLKFC